jgi:hypothetical protein
MTSDKQFAANQANAQHSTGPTSAAGKAKPSLNAVKSGLTGVSVLLPHEDVAAYEALVARVTARYSPVGPCEQALVQSIADADWRLRRIPVLEHGIYAMGHSEFAPLFADQPEHLRAGQIQTKTYMTYEKQLRNLQSQERRIRNHREEDLVELAELQAERRAQREQQLKLAALAMIFAVEAGTLEQWTPQTDGFEFSIDEVIPVARQIRPNLFNAETLKNMKKVS